MTIVDFGCEGVTKTVRQPRCLVRLDRRCESSSTKKSSGKAKLRISVPIGIRKSVSLMLSLEQPSSLCHHNAEDLLCRYLPAYQNKVWPGTGSMRDSLRVQFDIEGRCESMGWLCCSDISYPIQR